MKTIPILQYSLGFDVWLRLALLLGIASMTLVARADGNARPVSEDWYAYDSNGNVILLTDEAAKPTARYQYDAFGKTLSATGPAAESNTYRFSTKPIETASGLAFYGYRYYAPDLGRWTAKDPIRERGGLNAYAFLANQTSGAVDRLGLSSVFWAKAVSDDYLVEIYIGATTKNICDPTKSAITRVAVRPAHSISAAYGVGNYASVDGTALSLLTMDGGATVIGAWAEVPLGNCSTTVQTKKHDLFFSSAVEVREHPGDAYQSSHVSIEVIYKCSTCTSSSSRQPNCAGNFPDTESTITIHLD
ncbi:MAG: RHS repeat-associated core domain-containing protein [Verrucomicrobiaceae bacterium]|nr:RHS repeat-associated core domain-containing protein [Verrucomicrobiaceae bacterium]